MVRHVSSRKKLETPQDYMRVFPKATAAVIAFSLGYATPTNAASILQAAHKREQHWCEWIYSCYKCDPLPAVRGAIASRHTLRGYMADYPTALAIVRRASASFALD